MASQVKQMEKKIRHKRALSWIQRFLLILFVVLIQAIYIPTSSRVAGGIEPRLPIDIFPVWAVWVLPYLLCYPLWIAGFAWALFKWEDQLFRSLMAAFLFTSTIASLIFIFFPTYVRADTFHANDIFTSLLNFVHHTSGRYDAFPSGHIYITTLLALFYKLKYPRARFYWILIPILVAFSTLFTHQHYIADLVGGLVVALLGYHFGLRWAGFSSLRRSVMKTPRLAQQPSYTSAEKRRRN